MGITQLYPCTVISCVPLVFCLQNAAKVLQPMSKQRIGIFSGTFDPVHKGHVAFALQAIEAANLDKVYFAPEVKPRRKLHITHIAHRVAMLKLAVRSQPKLGVLELPERYFSAAVTVPKLQQKFPDAELVLLLGSDLFEHMNHWPQVELLLQKFELLVGARGLYEVSQVLEYANQLPSQPRKLQVLDSIERELSSKTIREAMTHHKTPQGILKSVEHYAHKHWLYHDLRHAKTTKN